MLPSPVAHENRLIWIKTIKKSDQVATYSLDQFHVFAAVVDCGGFAAAARKLGRAQSAVTYAIRGLEEQTGLVLFDRSHYRPQLTDAGRALLPRARRLLDELEDFQQQADGFAHGVEAALSIVVNNFTDPAPVIRALDAMRQVFPSVRVRIAQKPFGEDIDMLRAGEAQLGVIAAIAPLGSEFESRFISEQSLVAVAAPSHALAAMEAPIGVAALRRHLQVVWTRAIGRAELDDLGVHALDSWRVTELDMKLRLIREGVGWGSLPSHLVQDDLANGRLRELQVESWEGRDRMPSFPTSVVRVAKAVLGPAARFLMETLPAAR